jgi:hypothetical protein
LHKLSLKESSKSWCDVCCLSRFQSSITTTVRRDTMSFCNDGWILINLLDISVYVHCNISLCLFLKLTRMILFTSVVTLFREKMLITLEFDQIPAEDKYDISKPLVENISNNNKKMIYVFQTVLLSRSILKIYYCSSHGFLLLLATSVMISIIPFCLNISDSKVLGFFYLSQESDKNGSDKNGSDKNGSDKNGSDKNGSDMNGSDENGSDENGSDENGSDENGSDENELSKPSVIDKSAPVIKLLSRHHNLRSPIAQSLLTVRCTTVRAEFRM